MFSDNISSMNFEEIVNFVEFWAISCLKCDDLKTQAKGTGGVL